MKISSFGRKKVQPFVQYLVGNTVRPLRPHASKVNCPMIYTSHCGGFFWYAAARPEHPHPPTTDTEIQVETHTIFMCLVKVEFKSKKFTKLKRGEKN